MCGWRKFEHDPETCLTLTTTRKEISDSHSKISRMSKRNLLHGKVITEMIANSC